MGRRLLLRDGIIVAMQATICKFLFAANQIAAAFTSTPTARA
jgi:hypothetical protein